MSPVAIYEIDRAFSQWIWLCDDHLAKRKAAGYQEKARRNAPHDLPCDDCRGDEPTTTSEGASDGAGV